MKGIVDPVLLRELGMSQDEYDDAFDVPEYYDPRPPEDEWTGPAPDECDNGCGRKATHYVNLHGEHEDYTMQVCTPCERVAFQYAIADGIVSIGDVSGGLMDTRRMGE